MGKIKATILAKKDRPVTDPKPPSMRRIKRMNREAVEESRSGRNNRMTPSRKVNLRSLRRSGKRAQNKSGLFPQQMPETVLFRFKKKHRPTETVVHEGGGIRLPKTSTRRVSILTSRADDSVRVKQLELMVEQGLGKIETKKRKTIWHRVDKQDKYFKP